MTVRTRGCSNIIIQDREENLDVWLKQKGLTILVHHSNIGWHATFDVSFTAKGVTTGPAGASDAFTAVKRFVNWLYGAELVTSLPVGERVPRFTEESIAAAVAKADHTNPLVAPE